MPVVKLSDVPRIRTVVDLSVGVSLEVRPITAYDLILMVGESGQQLGVLFGKVQLEAKKGKVTNATVQKIIMEMMIVAPDVVGNIIALICDQWTPEGREAGKNLPLVDQMNLLTNAARLTLASEATVEKLVSEIGPLYQILSGMIQKMRRLPISQNGTGASAGTSVSA